MKVTRKGGKPAALRIANAIVSTDIKQTYDKTKSPSQNLANLGLDPDPNNSRKKRGIVGADGEQLIQNKVATAFMGFATIPQSSQFQDKNVKRRIMSEIDQVYIKNLMTKYGDNYKAMERDIKLNYNQLTEQKCKTMSEKFLNLDGEQRLVAYP